jgi:hypothetical protein
VRHNKPFQLTAASLPTVARAAAGERQRSADEATGGYQAQQAPTVDERVTVQHGKGEGMTSTGLPTGPFACEIALRRIRAPQFVREDKQSVTYIPRPQPKSNGCRTSHWSWLLARIRSPRQLTAAFGS